MLETKLSLPAAEQALPGRKEAMQLENRHYVHGRPIQAPFSDDDSHLSSLVLGMGCFWGVERKFWSIDGVYTTAVGYGAGFTPNPSYEEVCSGLTGHNELVLVVYDENIVSTKDLLKVFFESHDPTQGMRQGNDKGTQYRSGIYYYDGEQQQIAATMMEQYQEALSASGRGQITTELLAVSNFFYAEQYHQQYLAKNPNGYCGLAGTGVVVPFSNCLILLLLSW